MTLTDWALYARQGAAALLLLSAVQFSTRAVWDASASVGRTSDVEARVDVSENALLPKRPDLEKLDELLQREGEVGILAAEAPPVPRIRRLLVDWGVPRSDVYVNGVLTGKTPYVGQISCLDGDAISIQVLPPAGAPRSTKVICHGPQLLAGTDRDSTTAKLNSEQISNLQ